MKDEQTPPKNRITVLGLIPFAMAVAVAVRLVLLIFIDGPDIRARSEDLVIKEIRFEAQRGNIYSIDQKLLATSMPAFDVYFDPVTIAQNDWDEGMNGLTEGLAKHMPGKTSNAWKTYIQQGRASGNRYLLIGKNISYGTLVRLKELPIFTLGKYKGGLIAEQHNSRVHPLNNLASRTIGRDDERGRSGLEWAFSETLSGKDGVKMMQRIAQSNYKPLHDGFIVHPEDGKDIITTIDTRIQDITHHALLRALEKYEAEHGTAVVMEVKTGEIRGIANLGKTRNGYYAEQRNYAVWESTEPGSTFKLATVMALLEDGYADTNTLIHTGDGRWNIYDKTIRDANVSKGLDGYGTITLAKAFALSSNVGIAKLAYEMYGKNPGKFVDRLYKIGLHKPLHPEIKGEGKPFIPKPSDPQWSGITLAWMAYGYETSFTPLQMLAFYNAVVNDGVMVKPYMVKEIRDRGRVISRFEPTVLNPSICSQSTLVKLKYMMELVITEGTGRNIRPKNYLIAGKTGTCQLEYWKKEGARKYQASFAGYFPADRPMYSVIVVINGPNPSKGYYGSTVAAPVARMIADNLYTEIPHPVEYTPRLAKSKPLPMDAIAENLRSKKLPNLKGLPGMYIIPLLENHGYLVKVKGNGTIAAQYPPAGSSIAQQSTIELLLQ